MKEIAPKDSICFQHSLKVEKNHIDTLNHVNNVVYLQWVNDISEKHWSLLSNDRINSKYFWICIRHEIDYLNQAFLDDKVDIYTWIGESKGVKSIRNVHIYKNETLLVKVQSTWCLMDAKTSRPTRINEDILGLIG